MDVQERLRGSIVVVGSPIQTETEVFAKLHVFKLFKKPIHSLIVMRFDNDIKFKYWFSNMIIDGEPITITGSPYVNEPNKSFESYVTHACEKIIEDLFE